MSLTMTPEQAAALADYQAQAESSGRDWRGCLFNDWMQGGSAWYRGEWAYLQQLRLQAKFILRGEK